MGAGGYFRKISVFLYIGGHGNNRRSGGMKAVSHEESAPIRDPLSEPVNLGIMAFSQENPRTMGVCGKRVVKNWRYSL